jgi:hypothetical protein
MIDDALAAFLGMVANVMEWADEQLEEWWRAITRWIFRHSSLRTRLSPDEARNEAEELRRTLGCFSATLHHGQPRAYTMEAAMEALDRWLLRHLGP